MSFCALEGEVSTEGIAGISNPSGSELAPEVECECSGHLSWVKSGGEQAGVDKANLSSSVSSQCESFRSLILQVPA